MSRENRNPSDTNILVRAARMIVPWIGLALVIAVLWNLVGDYRSALDESQGEGSAETTPTAGAPAGQPYVLVLSEGLNLRAEPSTTAGVVKVLALDQQLVLIEEGVGWYHVRDTDGVEGWVAAGGRYTQLVQP